MAFIDMSGTVKDSDLANVIHADMQLLRMEGRVETMAAIGGSYRVQMLAYVQESNAELDTVQQIFKREDWMTNPLYVGYLEQLDRDFYLDTGSRKVLEDAGFYNTLALDRVKSLVVDYGAAGTEGSNEHFSSFLNRHHVRLATYKNPLVEMPKAPDPADGNGNFAPANPRNRDNNVQGA